MILKCFMFFFNVVSKNVFMEFLVDLKTFQWSIKGVSMVFAGCFKSYFFQTRLITMRSKPDYVEFVLQTPLKHF